MSVSPFSSAQIEKQFFTNDRRQLNAGYSNPISYEYPAQQDSLKKSFIRNPMYSDYNYQVANDSIDLLKQQYISNKSVGQKNKAYLQQSVLDSGQQQLPYSYQPLSSMDQQLLQQRQQRLSQQRSSTDQLFQPQQYQPQQQQQQINPQAIYQSQGVAQSVNWSQPTGPQPYQSYQGYPVQQQQQPIYPGGISPQAIYQSSGVGASLSWNQQPQYDQQQQQDFQQQVQQEPQQIRVSYSRNMANFYGYTPQASRQQKGAMSEDQQLASNIQNFYGATPSQSRQQQLLKQYKNQQNEAKALKMPKNKQQRMEEQQNQLAQNIGNFFGENTEGMQVQDIQKEIEQRQKQQMMDSVMKKSSMPQIRRQIEVNQDDPEFQKHLNVFYGYDPSKKKDLLEKDGLGVKNRFVGKKQNYQYHSIISNHKMFEIQPSRIYKIIDEDPKKINNELAQKFYIKKQRLDSCVTQNANPYSTTSQDIGFGDD